MKLKTILVSIFTLLSVSHSSAIKKRGYPPLSLREWQQAVREGCTLLEATGVPDVLAVTYFAGRVGTIQNEFINYPADFTAWGYRQDMELANLYWRDGGPELKNAMEALGIDWRPRRNGGSVVPGVWRHREQSKHGDVTYPPTGAQFATLMSWEAGVIVGWVKYGPAYMGSMRSPPVTTFPRLKGWGDIVGLEWIGIARQNNLDASNLKYVISADVDNSETFKILQYALKVDDIMTQFCDRRKAMAWNQRREISMRDASGRAILSSPNGRGAALLLIRHKNTFGDSTTITKVTIWCGWESEPKLHLMFHVVKKRGRPKRNLTINDTSTFDEVKVREDRNATKEIYWP